MQEICQLLDKKLFMGIIENNYLVQRKKAKKQGGSNSQ